MAAEFPRDLGIKVNLEFLSYLKVSVTPNLTFFFYISYKLLQGRNIFQMTVLHSVVGCRLSVMRVAHLYHTHGISFDNEMLFLREMKCVWTGKKVKISMILVECRFI